MPRCNRVRLAMSLYSISNGKVWLKVATVYHQHLKCLCQQVLSSQKYWKHKSSYLNFYIWTEPAQKMSFGSIPSARYKNVSLPILRSQLINLWSITNWFVGKLFSTSMDTRWHSETWWSHQQESVRTGQWSVRDSSHGHQRKETGYVSRIWRTVRSQTFQ